MSKYETLWRYIRESGRPKTAVAVPVPAPSSCRRETDGAVGFFLFSGKRVIEKDTNAVYNKR